MNTIKKNILLLFTLFAGAVAAYAQSGNPVIDAIQKEVDRNKDNLKMESMTAPFFISYSVVDMHNYEMSASLGSISYYDNYHIRRGMPRLLVGDYLRNNLKWAGRDDFRAVTSLSDNATGVPITIWQGLDGVYKMSIETFKEKMAILQQQTQTPEEAALPDFEQVQPANILLPPVPVKFDKAYWENYLRKASETARQYPDILNSTVSLSVKNLMTCTYNTEGSRYAAPTTFYRLTFTANTRADDGQDLSHTIYVENATFEQMPDAATFAGQCQTVMENLVKLKNAPVIDDSYCGPVLFEGSAAGRVFEGAFMHNRLAAAPTLVNNPRGGNNFELMLNKKVVSRSITVKSITGQEFYKGQRLNGYYAVDAEGMVPDKELTLIENGVLRNMLNGRTPTKKIRHSNGHVRFDHNSGALRVLPGNLLVTTNLSFNHGELRTKLLAAAKEEDLDYAYVVRQYEGGINMMYRVYVADGREELVRGAVATDAANLRTFKRILGTSDREMMASYGEIQSTIVCPDAILFEEMDIVRNSNIEFKKPYIVPKP